MKKEAGFANKQVIILHGNDEQAIEELLRQQIMTLPSPDPATAELNTVQMEGQRASFNELQTAVLSMPFLAEKKLIIIRNGLTLCKSKETQQAFLHLLDSLPPYAILALIIADEGKNRKNKQGQWEFTWDTLNEKHWLMLWLKTHAETALLRSFSLPTQDRLPQWLMEKAREKGGALSSTAAFALANAVGADTRILTNELDKLLLYVNYAREVTEADVHLLTSQQQQTNVFDMIDALSNQRHEVAYRLLHQTLADEDSLRVFGMITRQFRLLIQANELLAEGGQEADIARELKQHPFVAKKLSQQARNFSFAELKRLYQQLQQLDSEIKVGKIQPNLAMELFIGQMAVKP
jgi:DNA polymerase III subunit delta